MKTLSNNLLFSFCKCNSLQQQNNALNIKSRFLLSLNKRYVSLSVRFFAFCFFVLKTNLLNKKLQLETEKGEIFFGANR